LDVDRELVESQEKHFAVHGWVGLGLIAIFWAVNWFTPGLRTYWAFFPLWLGYCLTVDALVLYRSGTSLLTRSRRKYVSLFLISAPVWWIFEAVNQRLQNWHYVGSEYFSFAAFVFWATLSFTTVIPAVFGTAELMTTFHFLDRFRQGPVISKTLPVTLGFFIAGWVFFALMMIAPQVFFPFVWISLYFILEPINVWLGFRSLPDWLQHGDWRPVLALWCGVLVTAFFWEMWNFFSYPKWIYTVPWGNWLHIFEMPLLGYGGYLPFSLELFAIYHFIYGLFGEKRHEYVKVE
jgi:hypothetical protein